MDKRYDPNIHHRRSIRLPGYDYAQPGAYFVTLCTQGRENLFGQISEGQMQLSYAGQVVTDCWNALPRHFPEVELDTFVMMPDHIHGILLLTNARTEPHSLGTILHTFKSVSTRRIHRMGGSTGRRMWQRGYYEHILRDEADLDRAREYIALNPTRWEEETGVYP